MKHHAPIKTLAIIDSATEEPSIACYNRLLQAGIPCSFHSASEFGTSTFEDLDQFYGGIIFGSASHVHQNLSWHHELGEWATAALSKGFPLLGICFGHQLLCHYFGAEVIKNRDKDAEQKGSREIIFKKDFGDIKAGDKKEFTVSHNYRVINLPQSLEEVASSELFPNDIVMHRKLPFVGIQPHPEASDHFIETEFKNDELERNFPEKSKSDGLDFIFNFINTYCKEVFKNSKYGSL